MSFHSTKRLKKCMKCHRKSKAIITSVNNDSIDAYGLCRKHFYFEFPDYTLGKTCISCDRNLRCIFQEEIFRKKQIKKFKKRMVLTE